MNQRLVLAFVTVVLLGTGCSSMKDTSSADSMGSASGQGKMDMHSGQDMMMQMRQFDSNGDGMLSKEEFMKAHEMMFERMKGPNGMISLKSMQMQMQKMMSANNMMMGKDHQMQGCMGKGAQ